jgi:SEC-C motif-containing protein
MRSRYTAYVVENKKYLRNTWFPNTCPTVIEFSPGIRWLGLKIIHSTNGGEQDNAGTVQFRARYKLATGTAQVLREHSQFYRRNGHWLYFGIVQDKTTNPSNP